MPATEDERGADERRATLYASLIEDAFEFVVVIDADLIVAYASRPIVDVLGLRADEVVGQSVADWIHPDDQERALLQLTSWENGAPGGSTSFRIRAADASWSVVDMTVARVTDGVDVFLAAYCRPADYQHATDEVLERLLNGADREGALTPVLDVYSWELNHSHIAVAWYEEGAGHRMVSTGLPIELTGADDDPAGPWAEARRTGRTVTADDHSGLPAALAELAAAHDRGGYAVTPVPDLGSGVPALITVWVHRDNPRAQSHAYGTEVAARYVEVILRWSSQVSLLNAAARRDPLTRLGNRTALFEALASGWSDGALLFCDLDHFKPVNDAHGHAAGDEVLARIARRMEGCVRPTDLVARVGGDEFVVAAPATDPDQAADLAARLQAAVEEPIAVAGTSVAVGLTIGIAHERGRITEATLARADDALMTAKLTTRGSIAWAPAAP